MKVKDGALKAEDDALKERDDALKGCEIALAQLSQLREARDSQFRIKICLSDIRNSLKLPEVIDLDDINRTMISPPPTTDSNSNKCANLAVLAESNEAVKRVRKEKDDTVRQLEAVQDESMCTVCLINPKNIMFTPCNHLLCCSECSGKVSSCPMCRANITDRTTVYL